MCKQHHHRCKSKKCTQCCKLHECNDILCSHCKKNNIECKRALIKSQEEFNLFKEKGISYSSGKFEPTKQLRLHKQIYLQFKDHQTIKLVKEIFEYQSMNFQINLNGNSDQNRDYSIKIWERCLSHKSKGYKCNYFIRKNICNKCNESCAELRRFASWTDKNDN